MTFEREFKILKIVLVCIVIGVIIAMLFSTMNSHGLIIDELITGTITITDLMFVTVFIFGMVGVMVGVLSS